MHRRTMPRLETPTVSHATFVMGEARVDAGAALRGAARRAAAGGPQLAGPCMLVTNGSHTIAVASAEVLRQAGEPLAILTRLDGSTHLAGRGVAARAPRGDRHRRARRRRRVHARRVSAPPRVAVGGGRDARRTGGARDVRAATAGKFERVVIAVDVATDDGGGMSDDITRLAIPDRAARPRSIDGAPLFAWMPPDPVLGRGSEVIAVAIGVTPRCALSAAGHRARRARRSRGYRPRAAVGRAHAAAAATRSVRSPARSARSPHRSRSRASNATHRRS